MLSCQVAPKRLESYPAVARNENRMMEPKSNRVTKSEKECLMMGKVVAE